MFKDDTPQMKRSKITIFSIAFIIYACLHACRSTWAYSSGEIAASQSIPGFTTKFLSYINFTYLVSFGLSLLIFGRFGDKIDVKYFTLFGCFGLGFCFLALAILYEVGIENRWAYLAMMCISGIFSSTPWPGLLSILNNWFPKSNKVIVLGFFAACINIGNILGFAYSGFIYEGLGLDLVVLFYVSAFLLLSSTIVGAFLIQSKPDLPVPTEVESTESTRDMTFEDSAQTPKIDDVQADLPTLSFWKAWTIPGVALYAVAFGCIKAVYQVLGFWLPNYLDSLNVSNVALINIMVDLGAMIGGISMCILGVKYNKRATLIVPSLWIGTIFMVAINFLKNLEDPVLGYAILSFFTGLFIGGCFNNIASAITVELSNKHELKAYKQAVSTVISTILGYGTTFVAFTMLLIPLVKSELFLYCGLQAMVGGLLLIPIIIHEWQPTKKDQEIAEQQSSAPKEIEMS